MIRDLFGADSRRVPSQARVPEGTCVYAIGDIHGRADLLGALHRQIEADAAARNARRRVVVYLGDYVDRGPQSREVIELLLDRPLPGFEPVHLIGNHEDFMLRFLDEEPWVGPDWFANGGDATVASYGVGQLPRLRGDAVLEGLQGMLRARIPERHLAFLRDLALWHVEGDYLFVHAGIRPGLALERQSRDDLLWIRGAFLHSRADHGRVVVHGHTIAHSVDRRPNRIGIDTGAFASGCLTCAVLQGTEVAFLQT
jgi:serine/threonine protein phosphatase 1